MASSVAEKTLPISFTQFVQAAECDDEDITTIAACCLEILGDTSVIFHPLFRERFSYVFPENVESTAAPDHSTSSDKLAAIREGKNLLEVAPDYHERRLLVLSAGFLDPLTIINNFDKAHLSTKDSFEIFYRLACFARYTDALLLEITRISVIVKVKFDELSIRANTILLSGAKPASGGMTKLLQAGAEPTAYGEVRKFYSEKIRESFPSVKEVLVALCNNFEKLSYDDGLEDELMLANWCLENAKISEHDDDFARSFIHLLKMAHFGLLCKKSLLIELIQRIPRALLLFIDEINEETWVDDVLMQELLLTSIPRLYGVPCLGAFKKLTAKISNKDTIIEILGNIVKKGYIPPGEYKWHLADLASKSLESMGLVEAELTQIQKAQLVRALCYVDAK